LSSLKCNSTGLDNIPAKFIKDGSDVISNPLAHIVNLSLNTGIVPKDLKSARVVPLHKKNSRSEVGNYRPVSILCIFSKILERIVFSQLESYLKSNNLLFEYQSGFRPSFSTDTCLIHLTDYVKQNMDKGLYTGMVLLDLQKAFDTVNHSILCNKLKAIGLNSIAVEWFTSYLSERSQLVNVNGVSSASTHVTCGVPQGSILGPLLFLIYVNDMETAVQCKLLLYADDSALLVPGKNIDEIAQTLTTELESINQWLCENKLSLHLGKTESILFGTHRKLKNNKSLSILYQNKHIKSVETVKYLGVDLNQSLNGETHAKSIVQKINGKVKFLYRQCRTLSTQSRKILCSAIIQPHFDYACSSWYTSLSAKTKHKLQICQNKIVRFINEMGNRTHVGSEELGYLGWLNVDNRVNQMQLSHMYKIVNGFSPTYLTEKIVKTRDIHGYNTRASLGSLSVPKMNGPGSKTFLATTVKLWNLLPSNIQLMPSFNMFKASVKILLFQKMQESDP